MAISPCSLDSSLCFIQRGISRDVVIQLLGCVRLFETPRTPGFPVLHHLSELAQTHVHRVGDAANHLILCRPLLLLPSVFSSIRVFSEESVLRIRWPKCWSFSFSISLASGYSGLISFRTDWLHLRAVQGTLSSLLQHQSSKALLLQCSAFCMVQLSHPYVTTGKTIALTRWTFVDQVMSLLFNMLSRLVITSALFCI